KVGLAVDPELIVVIAAAAAILADIIVAFSEGEGRAKEGAGGAGIIIADGQGSAVIGLRAAARGGAAGDLLMAAIGGAPERAPARNRLLIGTRAGEGIEHQSEKFPHRLVPGLGRGAFILAADLSKGAGQGGGR